MVGVVREYDITRAAVVAGAHEWSRIRGFSHVSDRARRPVPVQTGLDVGRPSEREDEEREQDEDHDGQRAEERVDE